MWADDSFDTELLEKRIPEYMVTIVEQSPWYSNFHILYPSILFKIIQVSTKKLFVHRRTADARLIEQYVCFRTVIDGVLADKMAQHTWIGIRAALEQACQQRQSIFGCGSLF